MRSNKGIALLVTLAGLAGLAAMTPAGAQPAAYPTKPIRLVIPFAAGGPADVVGREVGQSLGALLGQTVVVENQGGGAGLPALNTVSRAPADGYTLLFAASGNVTVQPLLYKKRVDVFTLLAPVGRVSVSPHVLVVSGKLPVHSAKELIAYARANPGKVNFGSAGVGGLAHLGMEMFKSMAKIDVNHVPYKGSSQVMTDLGSGEVQALFSSMPSLTGLADKGTIRAIGITAPSSSPGMKGLPVISESGLPGFSYTTWYGVFTAAGTPPAVIEQLSAALKTLGADETLRRRLDEQGVELQVGTPRELEVVTRKESAQWEKTIRAAHIELN